MSVRQFVQLQGGGDMGILCCSSHYTAMLTLWNTNMLLTIVVLIGKHPVSIAGSNQLTFRDIYLFFCYESQTKHHIISLVKNYINLLNPTGHLMHQQFNIQQLYALPTLYLCVLYLSENKQRLVPLTA